MATIAVLGTLDSKGHEHAFVADAIRRMGHLPLLIDAELVDRDDVRMFELGGDLGLLDEAEHGGLVAGFILMLLLDVALT